MTSPSFAIPTICLLLGFAAPAAADLSQCLDEQAIPRVVRVTSEADGAAVWARVVTHVDGVPTAVSPLAKGSAPLEQALALAVEPTQGAPIWPIAESDLAARVCSPLPLSQRAIDAEETVVVAAGLNYAAHAEEAGGGDVFLFPKPVAPRGPYAVVAAPEKVTLLDYEVELAFVLLETVDLSALPSREKLLAQSAFFVSNDITDREPIIIHKAYTGPGTGFVEAKGQPGFLPAGPWIVRGTELFAALSACGGSGLRLALAVDEGDGFTLRQDASTSAMILDPVALLERIASEVESSGFRTAMPVQRGDNVLHYPLAIPGEDGAPMLPAGSVVLTGTPEGVAIQAPSMPGLIGRALLNLRGPLGQFRHEQLELAASGAPGAYLAPGDRVRASIDGLGAQISRIEAPGTPLPPDPCEATTEAPTHVP